VKQSELRRWLAAQGAEFKDGTNHLKIYLNGKQTVMPRHPGKEIPEPLRRQFLSNLASNKIQPLGAGTRGGSLNQYAIPGNF
jgi:mRNA interferase HicA